MEAGALQTREIVIDDVVFTDLKKTKYKNNSVGYNDKYIIKIEHEKHPKKLRSLSGEIEIIKYLNSRECVSSPRIVSEGRLKSGEKYFIQERIYGRPGFNKPADMLFSVIEQKNFGVCEGDLKKENFIFNSESFCNIIDYDQAIIDERLARMGNIEYLEWFAQYFENRWNADYFKFIGHSRDEIFSLFKNDSFNLAATTIFKEQITTNSESGIYHSLNTEKAYIEGARDLNHRLSLLNDIEFKRGESVLDVGCNMGLLGHYLHDRGCRVTGVDMDRKIVAGAKMVANILNKNIQFKWLDLDIGKIEEDYDTICLFSVIHHVKKFKQVTENIAQRCNRIIIECGLKEHGSKPINGKWTNTSGWEFDSLQELTSYLEAEFVGFKFQKNHGNVDRNRGIITFVKNKRTVADVQVQRESPVNTKVISLNKNGEDIFAKGDFKGALDAFKKALDIDSSNAIVHNNLGVLYYNQGDKEKALNHYKQAAQLQPENITFQKNLADFYYVELGRVEEALEIYVKILNINPEDVETLLILGHICIALKKFDDAEDFYRRVLTTEPWNKDAKQFLKELEKYQLSVTGDQLGSENNETTSKEYLVSAIVSTYNSERFIRGCLENLEGQTIADRLEIIVVNSGSEQNEEAVVREFQEQYKNIRYIKTKDRETVYQAWNRGIKASNAKYITNANTDDRRYNDSIEVLVNVLEDNPDVVLAYGNFQVTDTENCIPGHGKVIEEMDYPPYERGTLLRSCYPGPMPIWRKKVHDEFGYFNESFVSAGDREFWCRISQKHPMRHLNKHMGVYYSNPEGIENRNKRSGTVQKEAERIFRRYEKSFQLSWNNFRQIDFHVEENFSEIKMRLEQLEVSGGGFRLQVQVSSCALDEYLWLQQKKNEGLIDNLSLTKKGHRIFPSVAILMFTYDRMEYSQEALYTLMKNTRYPFDLYIVDNHSTDGTREWLEEARRKYPDRIKDIRYNSHNEGLPGPTNDFWNRVDAELIGKVDNDTLVPQGWLKRLVEAHQKIPKLAVVGGYHFRPEDFDDKSVRLRLFEQNGIRILPDLHIGGCCYLMKKSIQQLLGPMKFKSELKIHGWTEYQHMLAGAGYIVGYLYPLIQLEYMDDPRSEKCLINEKYQDYTRKVWQERGIDFKSTDQIIEWLHRDAQRIIKQPPSETLSSKEKNQPVNKSYYGFARPEIQDLVSQNAKKILDIGCGAGVLGKELKHRRKRYVAGIEYTPEAAIKAETVLDKVYMGNAVKILPEMQENSFDTIIMADFLEHIANPEKILFDVKRILTPGGKLVLSIPNVRH
jgi:2-polyprenyl-3-methyl-5-hydroxy-6-metoxy-1,4-benzoquinol methylase/GT2 family glycosyltransferase/Tfp pilus assembly protein PilF